MHHPIPVFRALLLIAFAAVLRGADEPFPTIGHLAVPDTAPFTATGGTVSAELPLTASWYADWMAGRWPHDKLEAEPAAIQKILAGQSVPVKIYFPATLAAGRRYPLFIGNITEFKDSRDGAGGYVKEAHAAGYVVVGFGLSDALKDAKIGDTWKVHAAVSVYVASVIARWAPIDPNRVYIGGHSGGAKISTGLYSYFPLDYAGLMTLGCNQFVMLEQGKVIQTAAPLRGAAEFCGTGMKDDIAPPASSKGVFEQMKSALKFPYLLSVDHPEGHATVDSQNKIAFEFFTTSYADWYAKTETGYLKQALAAAKGKRFGEALLPLLRIASFKPESEPAKQAQAQLDLLEADRTAALAKADELVAAGKKPDAKRALLDAAKRFAGCWYQPEFVAKAQAIGK
ncbi:MAG: hypothetical protein H0X38_11535 [Planctomycetes bacterium]|nr:hypothetical protein [Planctomycetota bacterium]